MPDPKKYENTEKGYKKFMGDCMHQTLHMERKEKERSVAQCLNTWRRVHGPKHSGKPKKKIADILRGIVTIIYGR